MAHPRGWEGAKLGVGALLLLVLGFYLASRFVSPAPPRTIEMAAGPEGGAYELFARGYAHFLEGHGIELRIHHSSGAIENLAMLRAGQTDVALGQTGLADPKGDGAIRSLGTLFHEPVWLFLRRSVEIERLSDLRGRRLDLGPSGSGTRALTGKLLALSGVTADTSDWLDLTGAEREVALAQDGIDAIFAVGSVDSPSIRSMLVHPELRLHEIERAEAHTRIDRSLTRVILPEGVIDFAGNLPARDTVLLSAMGELLVTEDLHPALIDLLLQAAASVHAKGDLFAEPGMLPSPRWVDLPLSPEAERYFKYGPPFLQRYLPFWAATQIDRLKVMLIPIIALLVPLVRIFPPTYRWRVRSRIYRWYRELREADPDPGVALGSEEIERRREAVARIEHEVAQLPTPTSYAAELYSLRLHVDFVRNRLDARRDAQA